MITPMVAFLRERRSTFAYIFGGGGCEGGGMLGKIRNNNKYLINEK